VEATPPRAPTILTPITAVAADPEPETLASLPAIQAAPATDVALPHSERVTIMELREFMCRWPLGDPTTPDFRFCGARSITGLPYCTHHARFAYQPVADRKRERKLLRA
jgi:GcrA cell cycle regulator